MNPSMFLFVNLILVFIIRGTLESNAILSFLLKREITDNSSYLIFFVIGIVIGISIFSILVYNLIQPDFKDKEERLLLLTKIFQAAEYASAVFIPYFVAVRIFRMILFFLEPAPMMNIILYSISQKPGASDELQIAESLQLKDVLASLQGDEFLIPFALSIAFSIIVWMFQFICWKNLLIRQLNLKIYNKSITLRMIIVVLISVGFLLIGVFVFSGKAMNRGAIISDIKEQIIEEEANPNPNYLKLAYLCDLYQDYSGKDKKNQFKYKTLSIAYEELYLYNEMKFEENEVKLDKINSDTNSMKACKLYLETAKVLYKTCETKIRMMEIVDNLPLDDRMTKKFMKEESIPETMRNSEFEYWAQSERMQKLKEKLDSVENLLKDIEDNDSSDYIYSDVMTGMDYHEKITHFPTIEFLPFVLII